MHATIFVVDKDPAFRALARDALAQLGSVEELASAREVLEAAEVRAPHLVVTELVMDDLGAFELLRRYGERFEDRHTPFLVVSKLADEETLTQCLDAGADDYVPKPVSATVLRARASALLRRSGSLDRRAILGQGVKRSVRLSRVLVNGHELVIETRFVPSPQPEIQTRVLAGERNVMCSSLPVPPELDSAEVDVMGLRAHARAEAEMRDRVTTLREQHQRAREGAFARQDDVQRLFDEGVGHALHAQWRDALACWERALEQDPSNAALQRRGGAPQARRGWLRREVAASAARSPPRADRTIVPRLMLLDPVSPRRRAIERGLAIFAMALVAGGVMWAPAFYEVDHSGWGDWQQMHHWAEVGVVSLRRWGEFPFWNPHHCGGVPHWGQPQAQNFSPIWMLLHVPFGTHLGHKLWILFHHVIGFAGLYLAARKLEKLSRAGAFLAATIWTTCGFSAWHYAGGHATFLAFEWYPFLLLAWRRADDDLRYTVAVAAIMTEMLLEGAHYAFPYAAVFLGFDSVARILRGKKREIGRLVRTGLVSALLTLAMGAIRWVPIMLAMSRYPRPIEDTDTLTFEEVVVMWTARDHDWVWRPHPWVWAEYGTYVGWGALVLVAIGIVASLRERRVILVAGALFFLAFTMGYHGPFWPSSVLHSMPFFSNLHLPSRWQVLCTFYMSLLAGLALSRFEVWISTRRLHRNSEWTKPLWPWLVALAVAVDIYVVALGITNRWDGAPVGFMAPETPHLTASRRYHEEYANYPSRNISTTECYDAVPWPKSTRLWTGLVPQVRFAAEDGTTMRAGDTLHSYDRTNHTVTIDVEMHAPGVAVVNQNYESQWHASTGELAPSEGRLAVRLPAGRHRVVFRFEPDDLPYSGYASLAGLVAGILILVLARPKGPRVVRETKASLAPST